MCSKPCELKAPIFNIQTYSIHDGPGIRVTVFEKGCPLRCLWCANPESNLATPQLMTYSSKCTGCGMCVPACAQKAISIQEVNGKMIAVTDRTLCKNCGKCVDVCPNQAREIAGQLKTVDEVIAQVEKDRLFIDMSGGGMTVSGGEPLVHVDFTEALLKNAKEHGLHTAIESCSYGSREAVDRIYKYIDLGLLDIKCMDSAKHKEFTGVGNEEILANIKHIHKDLGVKIMISIPTITGYNDSDENIDATAKFIKEELGDDVAVRLLPYHRLGESKNESLGKTADMSIEIPSQEHMEHLKGIVESYGLKAQIGG